MQLNQFAALCALLLVPGAALAQADNRLRDALRSATAQVRSLEEEQAKWQAREAQYKREAEALRAEVLAAKKSAPKRGDDRALRQQLAVEIESATQTNEALESCLKTSSEKAAAQEARAKELEAQAAAQLDSLGRRTATCESKNARLVAAGKEFVEWLSQVNGTVCEPFLGLRRVALENRAQEFVDKLLEQKPPAHR